MPNPVETEKMLLLADLQWEKALAEGITDPDVRTYGIIWEKILAHSRAALDELKVVVQSFDLPLPETVRQPEFLSDFPSTSGRYVALLKMALQEKAPVMYQGVSSLAASLGCRFVVGTVKRDDRIFEKSRLGYRGDFGHLKDIHRGCVVCKDVATVVAFTRRLVEHPEIHVARVKNRFDPSYDAKISAGYRDLQCNIRIPSTELYWELQVHLADIEQVKSQLQNCADQMGRTGHGRYVALRTIKERVLLAMEDLQATVSAPNALVSPRLLPPLLPAASSKGVGAAGYEGGSPKPSSAAAARAGRAFDDDETVIIMGLQDWLRTKAGIGNARRASAIALKLFDESVTTPGKIARKVKRERDWLTRVAGVEEDDAEDIWEALREGDLVAAGSGDQDFDVSALSLGATKIGQAKTLSSQSAAASPEEGCVSPAIALEKKFVDEALRRKKYEGEMSMFVRNNNGRLLQVHCAPWSDVKKTVMEQLLDVYGIAVTPDCLFWCGKQIEFGRTAFDYNMQFGSTILSSTPAREPLRTVAFHRKEKLTALIAVQPSETIATLKQKIQEQVTIFRVGQRLTLTELNSRKELDDKRTLSSYDWDDGVGICDAAPLLTRAEFTSGQWTINVKTLTNRVFTLRVEPDELIEYVKARIEFKEGTPPDNQRLIFKSKQMDVCLADYEVANGDTIHLVTRLRAVPFSLDCSSPGASILSSLPSLTVASDGVGALIAKLGGSPTAVPVCDPDTVLLDSASRSALISYADARYSEAPCDDLLLTLCEETLRSLLGSNAFEVLADVFGVPIRTIKLRRCSAVGKCVAFHTDYSRVTMQVALNGDDEYEGGRLVFATGKGLVVPKRPAGTATIHDERTVHGVTTFKAGIRYGILMFSD